MRIRSSCASLVCFGLCCLLLLPACRRESGSFVEGSYATVSESEWNITLILKRGGVAEILEETWAPGEYESRTAERTTGRWRLDGDTVILEYRGITDRLAYDPKLSAAVLGYKGGAPGLQQSGAFAERSTLRDHPLWRLPHKFTEGPRPK